MAADSTSSSDVAPHTAWSGPIARAWTLVWRRRLGIASWLVVLAFAIMVARFWHPYYGMTRLLQLDSAAADRAIHQVRENPVFVYPEHGGYDGLYYAQIAYHPTLDSKELDGALDNPGFRSRRILMSAVAWLVAGGREARIADVFAWINIVAWFAFAAVLWHLLDVRDGRSWMAWAALLFSAGALHSVRLSLTDLPAALLIAGAMLLIERGRLRSGVGLIAAAALTRETSALAAAGPASIDWRSPRAWARNAGIGLAIGVPIALWLVYVHQRFGPGDAGMSALTAPLLGWLEKWPEILREYEHPAFRRLVTTTLLATVGISVQAVFFIAYRRVNDAWWRIGAINVLLGLFLGRAMWEGHPGSFTRVLLPMSLAFAVCVVRWRVPLAWLVLGSLSVFAGVEPWREYVVQPRDLSSGRVEGHGYMAELREGFSSRQRHRGQARAFSSGHGRIELRFTSAPELRELTVTMQVRGFDARTLEVRDGEGVVWSGPIDRDWMTIEARMHTGTDGRWLLDFASPEPSRREADVPGASGFAFAVRDLRAQPASP